MKGIIVYKSKTGFTKKYAKWIREDIDFDFKSVKKLGRDELKSYDIVVFGSYVRAGSIHGLRRMRRLVGEEKGKKLVLFVTGATPASEEKQIEETWKRNIGSEGMAALPHFYMQSGLNYDRMSVIDRLMMKTLIASMKLKRNKTKEDYEMIKNISHSYDASSKKYIAPLVEYIKTSC